MQRAVDAVVVRHDPEARHRSERTTRGRYIDIAHDRDVSYLTGELNPVEATLLDRRLTAMAHSVCDNDPARWNSVVRTRWAPWRRTHHAGVCLRRS